MIVTTPNGEYHEGGIYEHYKVHDNGKGEMEHHYYMIDKVAHLHDSIGIYLIIYHRCTKDGIYVSIREPLPDGEEKIIHQPFATHETRWNDIVINHKGDEIERFKLIKTK